MKPEQVNNAIAKLRGWRRSVGKHPKSGNPVEVWTDGKSGWCHLRKPPRYVEDLNACWEMEATLNDSQHRRFRRILAEVVHEPQSRSLHSRKVVSAAAIHRWEALLKTLNLWEETE